MSLKQKLQKQDYLKEGEIPFEELQEGEHFFNSEGTEFVKMPQGFDPDWPLANARRVSDPHLRGGFGPWAGVRKKGAMVDQQRQQNRVRQLQQGLAANYRERTGQIPRGQLWQECALADCHNEPVCMNCLLCEQEHCHCFDDEGA